MANLKYVRGDATSPQGQGVKIIAHVCNNIGAWGAGFVIAVSNRFPEVEKAYRGLDRRRLGMVQYVHIAGEDIVVANMIAQNGINDSKSGWRGDLLSYEHLRDCLGRVFNYAKNLNATVHMPFIGCGLAGSNWSKIEPLVIHCVKQYNIDCFVYEYEKDKNFKNDRSEV